MDMSSQEQEDQEAQQAPGSSGGSTKRFRGKLTKAQSCYKTQQFLS